MTPRKIARLSYTFLALATLAAFVAVPARAEDAKDSKDAKDASKDSAAKVDGTCTWSFTGQTGVTVRTVCHLARSFGRKVFAFTLS